MVEGKFNKDVKLALNSVMKRLARLEEVLGLDHLTSIKTTKDIDRLIELSKNNK